MSIPILILYITIYTVTSLNNTKKHRIVIVVLRYAIYSQEIYFEIIILHQLIIATIPYWQ